MKKIIKQALSMLLCGLIILVCIPPPQAKAATVTPDNPIIFSVRGTVGSGGDIEYQIVIDDIYSADGWTYQAFTITYPAELEISFPGTLTSTWNLFENTGTNPKSLNAIIKTGHRSPASLKTDLQGIHFTLISDDEFPPDESTVTITATKDKVTFFQDERGYVHYYMFVPWSAAPGGAFLNWIDAYNDAKNRTMQDPRYPSDPSRTLQGYLATLTSEEEQVQVYTAIATDCGWLGGTRLIYIDGGRIQDEDKIGLTFQTNGLWNTSEMTTLFDANYSSTSAIVGHQNNSSRYWYWACGPEAWTYYDESYYTAGKTDAFVYGNKGESVIDADLAEEQGYSDAAGHLTTPLLFYSKSTYSGTTSLIETSRYDVGNVKGVYNNFANPYGYEHNAVTGDRTVAASGGEPNDSSNETVLQFAWSSKDTWNDYRFDNSGSINGYYVEFGGYPGDPKAEELIGSDVTTTSEVELAMPIIVQYRSAIIDSYDTSGNPVYRRISSLSGINSADRFQTYENQIPYTVERDIPPGTNDVDGYTPYGYKFIGQAEDENRLTTNSKGDVSGFHSNHTQRIIFLFQPDSYTVTFNANFPGWNSADVSPGTKTVYFDSPYGDLATAIRPGYTLEGWYSDGDGIGGVSGTKVVPYNLVTDTAPHTLYANWTKKTGYSVYYDLNDNDDGTVTSGSITAMTGLSWDAAGLLPASPIRTGYIFVCWDVSQNGEKQGVTTTDIYGSLATNDIESSITLQAQWLEEDRIMVIYHLNGAEAPTLADLPDGEMFYASDPVDFPDAVRKGYVFAGWKVSNNGFDTEDSTYPAKQNNMKFEDIAGYDGTNYAPFVILEAQWTPNVYTVKYDINDEAGLSGSGVPAPKDDVLWNQRGLVPPDDIGNPTWEHNTFMGWNTEADGSGKTVYVGTTYAQLTEGDDTVVEMILYAQWIAEKSYYVRYDTNGGIPAAISDKTDVYMNDVALIPFDPAPPKGYDYAGWRVTYNGSKIGVTAADKFGDLATDPNLGYIVLTAQYSPKGGYTVQYNLNGHAQVDYPTKKPDTTLNPEDPFVVWTQSNLLPNADPISDGWTFLGWNTSSDGNGITATNADTYGVLAGGNDLMMPVTLYAQWSQDEPDKYTVRYNLNGGNQPSTPIDDIVFIGAGSFNAIVPAPAPIPPTGYSFDRWVVDDNGYGQGTAMSPDGQNIKYSDLAYSVDSKAIVLGARYVEKNNYTVIYDLNYSGASAGGYQDFVKWTQSGFTPYMVSRPGFTLLGWTPDSAGLGSYVLSSTQYKSLAAGDDTIATVTLYAQWEAASFIIRYDLNGTDPPIGSSGYNQRTVGFDDTGLIPPSFERLGYTLAGWNVSENGFGIGVTTTDSYRTLANPGAPYITLQAQWAAKEYTVYYDLNGGGFAIPGLTQSAPGDIKWWSMSLLPSELPTQLGYTFTGWKLSKIGTVAIATTDILISANLTNSSKYSDLAYYNGIDTSNITIQAQWIEDPNVTINYSQVTLNNDGITQQTASNGGTISKTSESVAPATGAPSVTAIENAGYTFIGWYASSDTTFVAQLAATATFTPATVSGLNIAGSYVALFIENADVTITYASVTGDVGPVGGTVNRSSDTIAPATGTALGSTAAVNPGYTFVGWFYFNSSGDYDNDTPISTNATFVPARVGGLNIAKDYVAYFVQYYSVDIHINKDGATWNDGSEPLVTLKATAGGPDIEPGKLRDGISYGIYVNGVYTNRDVAYNSVSVSLDFYSVEFAVKDVRDANGSTISATYDELVITGNGDALSGSGGIAITSGDIVLGGGDLVVTATGAGADTRETYEYKWSGEGTSGETVNAITINALDDSVDALCTVTGTNHYKVAITVIDEDGNPLEDIDVELQQFGDFVDGGTTASDGEFEPNPLPSGYYNIVFKFKDAGGIETTVTELVHITEGDMDIDMSLLQYKGRLNSKFEQKATDPVAIAVGGLHEVYNAPPADSDENGVTAEDMDIYNDGGAILIRLEANAVDIADPQKTANDAAVASDGKEFGFDLDLSAFKDVWEFNSTATKSSLQLNEINSLVTIYIDIPVAQQNKTGYVVYRYHDGQVERIPQYPAVNSYGEYFEYDQADQVIILTVRKFSVYTIAYNPPVTLQDVTITLDVNGGRLPPGVLSDVTLPMGESYSSPIPTRSGYTFNGWIDNDGNIYPPGAEIVVNYDITITAQWARSGGTPPRPPDRTVTVTFNSNGGIGEMEPVIVTANETYTLPENRFTNARYRFIGWKIDNAGGTLVAGTEITVEEDITIYAQWAVISTNVNVYVNLEDISPLMNTDEHKEYIYGRPNSRFAPEADMTRAEVAQMFYNLLRDKDVDITVTFADVAEGSWYYTAVNALASLGFLGGFPDGLFHPEDSITRAQFAAIIVRLAVVSPGSIRFDDVPESHWAYDYINTAAAHGWIQGVGDGLFEPERNISRAEAITLVNRMLGRYPDKDYIDGHTDLVQYSDLTNSHWAYYEVMEASNSHDFERYIGGEFWK